MKKAMAGLMVILFCACALVTISNLTRPAYGMPEVQGWWQDDPSCGPGGWRCWECQCHTCWCRDVSSGDCCPGAPPQY
jgi:hypothetical protein